MVPVSVTGRQRDGRSHGAYSKLSQPRPRARFGRRAAEAAPQPYPFLAETLIGCGIVLALVVLGLSLTILLAPSGGAPAGMVLRTDGPGQSSGTPTLTRLTMSADPWLSSPPPPPPPPPPLPLPPPPPASMSAASVAESSAMPRESVRQHLRAQVQIAYRLEVCSRVRCRCISHRVGRAAG